MKKITFLSIAVCCMVLLNSITGFGQGTVQIGSGTSTITGSAAIPVSNYVYNYNQQIVTANEYAVGGGVAGDITKIRYYATNVGTTTVWDQWTVYIGNTTKTAFTSTTDWVPLAELTEVFSGTITAVANEWFEITFSAPFDYTGGNIVVAVHEYAPDWTLQPTFRSYTSSANSGIYYRNDTTNPSPTTPPTATGRVAALPQIQFEGALASCLPPAALTASNITTTSADLGWTESGTSTNWDIEWGTDGFTPTGTPNVNDTADNPYELSGLSVDTDYDFYVRSDCGADDTTDTSAWVGPFSFSTLVSCPAPTTLTVSNITTTSADLGWTEGGTSTNWDIEWGVDGFTPTETPNVNDTGDNPYELTGLTANTAYDFYVRADCGADDTDVSTWSGPFGFTTACDAFGDFTEGFESYGTTQDPDCWSENLGGSAGYVYTSSSDTNTGVRALRTGNSGTASAVHYIISPQLVDMSAGTHRLSFFVEASANIASIEVGRMTDSESTATFTVEEAISWTTTMAQKTVYFDTPSSDNYFAIRVTFGTGTFSYASFDDFVWEPSPSCIEPSSLTATNFTPTSADLGWTENGSATAWDIEWGLDGFTPTGTPNVNDTGNNPYNLGGLAANTDYEFYVRADCGSDNTDVSVWSGPFGFTTECDVFTPEYNADMSLNVPECWKEANNGDAASGPSEFGAGLWFASNHNGTPSNVINLFSDVRSDWIISPVFDLSSAAPSELRVYVALTESTTSGSGADLGSDDEVSLLMTTDGGTSWTALQSWTQGNVPTDVGEQITYDLSAVTVNVQFAFLGDEGSVNDTEDVYFHVSQFQVRETPACIEPSALTATNFTVNSAELDWTENGTAATWDIEWGEAGFTPTGTPTINDTSEKPYNLSGLSSSTNYEFYVRADCGADNTDVSAWSGPFAFATECDATNTPYIQNFDASTSIPLCTEVTNEGSGNLWMVNATTSYGFTPNHLRYSWNSSFAANTWFFTQGINLTGGQSYSIAYDYGGTGTTYPENLKVAYGTDPTAVAMVNDLADHPGITSAVPVNNSLEFTPTTTGVYYFGFQCYSTANEFYLHLDNIMIDETLGVNELAENGFTYFPNPVKNTLNLKAQSAIQNVSIYNMLGQEVLSTSPNALNSEIDMASLQTGAYFVKVTINDATETIRVIKQ